MRGDFKSDLLKYGFINYDTGVMNFPGNIRAFEVIAGNLVGNIITSNVPPNVNIDIIGNVVGNSVTTGQVNATTISSSSFLGNGSLLTGVTKALPSKGNIDIVGNVIAPGNILVYGQVNVLGNVVAPFFVGNGSRLTNVFTLPMSANIDIVGNVIAPGNIAVSGQVNVFGNVAAQYFIGNGSQLAGVLKTIPAQGAIDITGNVIAPGNIFTGGQVNVLGNVSAGYFIGNGSQLTGLTSGIPSRANIDIVGNVNAPGNVSVAGQVNIMGNIVARYFFGNGSLLTGVLKTIPAQANIDIIGNVIAPGDINVAGQVNVIGNVTGGYFVGNGSLLSGIVTNIPSIANINIVGNVVAPGNITVTGQINVTGNVVGTQYFFGNGIFLSGAIANIPALANIDVVGNVVAPGNVNVAGQVNVIGNVSAGYFVGNGSLLTSVTSTLPGSANVDIVGNVVAPGNVVVAGQVNVIGNATAQYFFGNGSQLTSVTSSLPGTANVDIVGNVAAPGNVVVTGQVNAIGNITAQFFVGNGTQLTGISSSLPAVSKTDIVGNVSAAGNVFVVGQVNVLGNVVASFFLGNGAQMSGVLKSLPANANIDIGGNVIGTYANVSNIIAVQGNIGNVLVVGGNITARYFFGNGSLLSNVLAAVPGTIRSDIIGNVSSNGISTGTVFVFGGATSNNIVTTANVTGTSFIGNGFNLTYPGLFFIPSGNVANAAVRLSSNLSPGSYVNQDDVGIQYLLTNSPASSDSNWIQVQIATLNVNGVFGRTGAVVAAINDYNDTQISLSNSVGSVPGGANVSNAIVFLDGSKATIINGVVTAPSFVGNLISSGNVDVSNLATNSLAFQTANVVGQTNVVGNVSAQYFFGNGLFLTGVTFSYPSVASIDIVGNVTNSGSSSTVTVLGQTTVIGNVTASALSPTFGRNLFLSSNVLLSNVITVVSNGVPSVLNTQVNVLGNVTSTGTLSGNNFIGTMYPNSFAGNILSPGNVDVTGNVVANTLRVNGNAFVLGNMVSNGLSLSGNLGASSNVNINGNVYLFGIPSATSGDTSNYTPLYVDTTSNVVTTISSSLTRFANVTSQIGNAGLMFTYNNLLFASGPGWNNNGGNYVYGYPLVSVVPSPIMFPQISSFTIKTVVHDPWNAAVLTTDGRVYWWGATANAGSGSWLPQRVSFGGAPITKLVYGRQRRDDGTIPIIYGTFAAIASNGTLWMWGANSCGQCGITPSVIVSTPIQPLPSDTVRDVFISQSDFCSVAALASTTQPGQLYVWGINSSGELGLGNTSSSPISTPTIPSNAYGIQTAQVVNVVWSGYVTSNAVSTQCCRLLLANGTTFASGYQVNGETGLGSTSSIPQVTFRREITGLSNIAAIGTMGVGSPAHYAILNNGNIVFCGNSATFGVNIAPYSQNVFTQFLGNSVFGNIALQGFQGAMLANVGSGPAVTTPKIITSASGSSTGGNITNDRYSVIVLDKTGNLYGCRFNRTGNFGNGYFPANVGDVTNGFLQLNQFFPPGNSQVIDVTFAGAPNSTGNEFGTIVSLADGTVLAAGTNCFGSVPNCYNPQTAATDPISTAVPYFVPIVGRNLYNFL